MKNRSPGRVYWADVEVFNAAKGTWVLKPRGGNVRSSSFFPDAYTSKLQVLKEIEAAYAVRVFPDPASPRYWEGMSPAGIKIGGYLNATGEVATAFPVP